MSIFSEWLQHLCSRTGWCWWGLKRNGCWFLKTQRQSRCITVLFFLEIDDKLVRKYQHTLAFLVWSLLSSSAPRHPALPTEPYSVMDLTPRYCCEHFQELGSIWDFTPFGSSQASQPGFRGCWQKTQNPRVRDKTLLFTGQQAVWLLPSPLQAPKGQRTEAQVDAPHVSWADGSQLCYNGQHTNLPFAQ